VTIADLINTYRLTNTSDRRREDPRHARWWVAHLGPLPVSELTQARVLHALDQVRAEGRCGTRAGSTVAFYLRFLRRVTAWGACRTYLPVDPCAGIPLPKEPTPPMRVLTEEEEAQLCQALGRPYSWWVRFAILTGLEQAEQFTLLWRSVQLERGLMLLPQGTTGVMVELSLPPDAVTILRLLRQDYPLSIWVFPDPLDPMRPADPHIFYVSRWTRTIERLGLPRLAWKDLRHTCGVRLAKQGVPIEEIASRLHQRELRQAYRYRAWQPGPIPKKPQPQHPRVPVFSDLTDVDLQALVAREATAAPLTFRDMCRLYAVHSLQQRPSRASFERLYQQLLHQWADRPLNTVTRKEVRIWYMGLSRTPEQANKALTFLRRVYNWASSLDLYEGINPAVGVPRYPSTPRERFLSLEEMQRFMEGLPHLRPKSRAYFLMLLSTGARLSEVRCLRWTDVEWTTRLWRKSRTKNGTTQCIPLPAQVVEALAVLPRISEWVFPGEKGKPWCLANPQKLWGLIRRRLNLQDVTIHDLRRTCASYLAIEGENLPTIQNVLNHRSLVHTSIYARLNTKAVDRALQAQADWLCSLTQAPEELPALEYMAHP
jgi:integrase